MGMVFYQQVIPAQYCSRTSCPNLAQRRLEARVKRALHREGQLLKKSREDTRAYMDWGEYGVIDPRSGGAVATHCDLEDLAQERGVMKSYETLAD